MSQKRDVLVKFLAGMFVVIGLILITTFIFTIGQDKGITQKKFYISVHFRNVGGLIEGAPILLSGVHVGTVSKISFLEHEVNGRRIEVVMSIFNKYKRQLDKNAKFTIQTEGILGEKIVGIDIVDGEKIDLSKPIIGEDPIDVQDLAIVFARAAESFTTTAEQLSQIDIAQLSIVMEKAGMSLTGTSQGVTSTLNELEDVTRKIKRLIDRVEQKIIDNELFKVF